MPPRTAFAFGFALGLLAVYFTGLLQGISLGGLLWRSGVGAVGFGAFCALLVFLLGDPLEVPAEEDPEATEEEDQEESGEDPEQGADPSPEYGQGNNSL
ncbi:hypothetical protein [Thiohalorhabdus methylotrophus]|uniref:Uncharacterized protein n=1 Tax=Thiohalorhabdus methylotrophus TaxID=3242694 RepID=A0ABV4TVX1_9GAMM